MSSLARESRTLWGHGPHPQTSPAVLRGQERLPGKAWKAMIYDKLQWWTRLPCHAREVHFGKKCSGREATRHFDRLRQPSRDVKIISLWRLYSLINLIKFIPLLLQKQFLFITQPEFIFSNDLDLPFQFCSFLFFVFQCLSDSFSMLSKACAKVVEVERTRRRVLGSYFRVAFFGEVGLKAVEKLLSWCFLIISCQENDKEHMKTPAFPFPVCFRVSMKLPIYS